jgi:hypothetical protein
MGWQQACGLIDEPGFGLMLLTRWTVAVAARARDRMLFVTMFAAINDRTEFARSTSSDHRQYLAVFARNVLSELGQIRSTVLPHHVGNGGHRGFSLTHYFSTMNMHQLAVLIDIFNL